MTRPSSLIAALATAGAAAALLWPAGGAGAGTATCIAEGTLPARVALDPNGVTIRTTLRGNATCTSASLDNGATALLDGPGTNGDVPMRWSRFGARDEATFYPTINRPGTYRLVDGDVQTYDAQSVRIPARWRETVTVVKYRGRFTHVTAGRGGVTATLQAYRTAGWAALGDVRVVLQRRVGDSWRTVAHHRTTTGGRVSFAVAIRSAGDYRLVSASTGTVWGSTRTLGRPGV